MDVTNRVKNLSKCINASLKVCVCCALTQLVLSPYALAGPTGGNIVGGSGNINHSNLNTTINQLSNRLAIDWQTFNINQNESVNFNQPGRSSIALNRILDQSASQIHGSITANGQIVLVNPNGVFFGKNSTVNAGGLFAAALDVNPEEFMQGRLDFKALENTSGLIVNEGRLEVIDGGALVLLGQQIKNKGLLVANLGTVALVAGSDISVRFNDF
ncbi:MAG: filamentous hemagglutinin N-terminal domain-containing protein, partial [Methylococcales bacterium]